MKNVRFLAVIVCVMAAVNFASAEIIRGIDIDFVSIGNADNAADTVVMNDGTTGYGSVGYNYRIGKYEVTNAQWIAFTAIAGTPTGNPSHAYDNSAFWTGIQQPTDVSLYEAAQFCNYLTSGDKSKGAYLFSGNNTNPGDFLGINRDSATSAYGTIYVIPTENEWYKAAYYKPNGSGYSTYATKAGESLTQGNGTSGTGWNYYDGDYATDPFGPWAVGSGSEELNGTFDMMGNVWEWTETQHALFGGPTRSIRGGAYSIWSPSTTLSSSYRYYYEPDYQNSDIGFRVVSVPEPTTLLLLGLGAVMLKRKRQKKIV